MRYEDLVIMVFMLLLTMSPINRTQDQMMVLMLNAVVLMLFGLFGYADNSHDGTQDQMMV